MRKIFNNCNPLPPAFRPPKRAIFSRAGYNCVNMESDLDLIRLLLARLEKISADSVWAHRASGIRGSLLRLAERIERGRRVPAAELKRVMDLGFHALAKAAEEKMK